MAGHPGKHRKPSYTRRNAARLAVAGAVIASPIAIAAPANASPNWDALAQCESSGNWSANTGNGFSGGLQFTPSTWKAYGGGEYSANAKDATREQQIAVAERVLQDQGEKAWPGCSSKHSWSSSGSSDSDSDSVEKAAEQTAESAVQHTVQKASSVQQPAQPAGGQYTVQAGDTLSQIAQKFGVKTENVFQKNTNLLQDPNMIFPGQQLDIR